LDTQKLLRLFFLSLSTLPPTFPPHLSPTPGVRNCCCVAGEGGATGRMSWGYPDGWLFSCWCGTEPRWSQSSELCGDEICHRHIIFFGSSLTKKNIKQDKTETQKETILISIEKQTEVVVFVLLSPIATQWWSCC
jgi:hypothetical protein